jgi:hypothetical protein
MVSVTEEKTDVDEYSLIRCTAAPFDDDVATISN